MTQITRMTGIYTKMTGTTRVIAMTMTGLSLVTGMVVIIIYFDAVDEVGYIMQM